MARSPKTTIVRPRTKTAPTLPALVRPKTLGANPDAIGSDLAPISEQSGIAAPPERLRDAAAAYSIFCTLRKADEKSAFNRAVLEDMVDGAPPQDEAALIASGMSFVYNLNFLEADARVAAALVSYDDLADSSEHLIIPEMKPNYLPPEDAIEALDIVAEEHATMVREESDFYSSWLRLAAQFVKHGAGFFIFPDSRCPWADAAGWDQVLIPRKTKATDKAITVFITRHSYRVDELYQKIADPAYAKGWNENEVRRAIVEATRGASRAKQWAKFWPDVQMSLKNNDLGVGIGEAEEVTCVQYLTKEYDGTYSFYIGLENGGNKEHLYRETRCYNAPNEAFISFTLGVGNGTFHSIRGQLWKLFPMIQASNRFQNKWLTNTDVAMTLLLQSDDGDSYDDMQITLGPAIGYLPPGAKVVERELPDVGTQGLPVIRHLGAAMQNNTGQFQPPAATSTEYDSKGNPETKYGLQSRQASQGALTENSVKRFYRSMDRYFNESFRRIQVIGATGGKAAYGKVEYPEVKEFYDRCKERGVPPQFIIEGIRKVASIRAIGNGSPQMRLLALDELNQMAGSLDETGRDLAARDRIAMRFGRAAADRYKPKVKRIAPDAQIAVIENAALHSDDIEVLPDQNHNVHAGIHVPKFQEIIGQLVQERDTNPGADMRPFSDMLQYAARLHTHASKHVQAMAANPLNVKDMKSYRAALEQGGNLLGGLVRQLQADERHAQDNGEGQPGQPAGDDGKQAVNEAIANEKSQDLQFKAQKSQQELQHAQESHQLDLQLKSAQVQQVMQKMQLEKIETDSKIADQTRKNRASSVTPNES